jgi:RHS repeat-associated protein
MSVYDLSLNSAGHNNNGYTVNGANLYTYDVNGNLTNDPYRGVSSIQYNIIDLPTLITRSSTNKIEMLYDATGNLLCRKTYTTSSTTPTETRDYVGPYEFVNNVIDFVQTSQGRYKRISAGVWRHEYLIKDHLGSARLWYADVDNNGIASSTEILSQTNYYAYGMEMGNSASGVGFNYKFNGIERVESYQMDFALYRGLDPILGKWYQIDPKAEKVGYHMSPYCAMNGNPVTFSDPDGAEPITMLLIGAGISVITNGISNVANHQNFFAGAFKAAIIGAASSFLSMGLGEIFGAPGSILRELGRAGAHFVAQGGLSEATGSGSFVQSGLSAGISSMIGSGIGGLGKNLKWSPTEIAASQIAGGGFSGGISSVISGGNFWKGFQVGISVAAFNYGLHGALDGDPITINKPQKNQIASDEKGNLYKFDGEKWNLFMLPSGGILPTDSPIEWAIVFWKTPFAVADDILGLAAKPEWKKVMSGGDVIETLVKNGWEFLRQNGTSHMIFGKGGNIIPVPNHKTIAKGTLASIKRLFKLYNN